MTSINDYYKRTAVEDDIRRLNEMARKMSTEGYLGAEPNMRIGSMHGLGSVKWELKYRNADFNNQMDHQSHRLEDVLKQFERFCKGCGYEFAGFAIVDEDGIPVNGLNPMARLEQGKGNEEGSL